MLKEMFSIWPLKTLWVKGQLTVSNLYCVLQADISPDYTVDLDLGCGVRGALGSQHKHKIFVSTYLGYGTNEARTRYYQHLLKTHLANR